MAASQGEATAQYMLSFISAAAGKDGKQWGEVVGFTPEPIEGGPPSTDQRSPGVTMPRVSAQFWVQ